MAALFADVAHRPQDPDNLFRIAIALERRAAFFTRHADASARGLGRTRCSANWPPRSRSMRARSPPSYSAGSRAGQGCSAPAPRAREPGGELGEGLINAAALLLQGHDAERVALVCGDQQLTHGELRDRVARAAAVWRARPGAQPPRRHQTADGLDWVVAFLGTLWAGGTAVAVNPRSRRPGVALHPPTGRASPVIPAESADDTPPPWRDKVVLVDERPARGVRGQPVAPRTVDPDTPAFWVHSSGTSGKPKAVVHAHRFAREVRRVSRERLGITADDRLFASSRLFFSYPQTNSLWAGLKLGATVVLDPQWPTAQSVAATVAAARPTVLFSPSLYRLMLHGASLRASRRPGCACAYRPARRCRRACAMPGARRPGCPWSAAAAPPRPWCWCSRLRGRRRLQPSPGVQLRAAGRRGRPPP